MKTIWKFPLTTGLTLQVPRGARVLDIRDQNGSICLWALVNTEASPEEMKLAIYGTGHELPEDPGDYLGSVHQNGFVWHVFETVSK